MSFKFVHAADLHLDSPCGGPRLGPAASAFARATFTALERLVSLCLKEGASFLVLAGDLYDTRDRSVRARLRLKEQLSRLDAAGIRTFIVHGNHDPLVGELGALRLPPSVTVFGEAWQEVALHDSEGRVFCRVQGLSHAQDRTTENLSRRFARQGPEFTLGLLHANVGGIEGHANYAPCSLDDLCAAGLDYWALGHVHTRQELALENGGVAVYPGNTQGRHANEPGPRGCVVVAVEEGRSARRFVPIDAVRWHRLDVEVEGVASIDAIAARVEDEIDVRVRGSAEALQAHAVRVSLTGRGPAHGALGASGALGQLEEVLREQLLARPLPIWLEGVRDRSQPELDLARVAAGGGLPAAVLAAVCPGESLLEALYLEEELQKLELALARRGLPSTRAAAPELLERAARRALTLLQAEDAG